MPRITLLTDFGTRDGFVGAVKGVIQEVFPGAAMDDVAHDLPRGDVPAGADGRFVVAPDNGLVTPVFEGASRWRAVEIANDTFVSSRRSRTFHGRDVFAPAAAWLARGVHRSRLGPAVEDPIRLDRPEPRIEGKGGVAEGEVIGSDRFGNLITNLPASMLAGSGEVEIAGVRVPVAGTYSEVEPGEPLALEDSEGRIEVAARDASAARALGVDVGSRVRVLRPSGAD